MLDLNALPLPELFAALTADGVLARLLALAREEDLGAAGDVTGASIIPADRRATAEIVARQDGVVAGLAAVDLVIDAFRADCRFEPLTGDGEGCEAGQALGRLSGDLRSILALERTMLNLLGRACGVASLTRRFVDAVHGTRAVICDTRKTIPGLRSLDKYAVRCGRGVLHRCGLHDAALYKDNHLAGVASGDLASVITAAARAARDEGPLRFVEVEVDSLRQLEAVLAVEAGLVDIILLDNMDLEQLRAAVAMRDERRGEMLLEASGGITLARVWDVARTGIDRISAGALTHAAPALDVGLDLRS